MGSRTKNLLLASVVTLASLLIGVEVAAYLTVPPIHVTSEGDAMAVFDREIGIKIGRASCRERVSSPV